MNYASITKLLDHRQVDGVEEFYVMFAGNPFPTLPALLTTATCTLLHPSLPICLCYYSCSTLHTLSPPPTHPLLNPPYREAIGK